MRLNKLIPIIAALTPVVPVHAQTNDCLMGSVTFETAGTPQTLSLRIHERRMEVAKGLFKITELPPLGGVFSIYDAPRGDRPLANSNVMPADLMSFSASGNVLEILEDLTGEELDYMNSGDGMLYAAYLAGGTIKSMGFNKTTKMTGWICTDQN
jgi:hypothetical protein